MLWVFIGFIKALLNWLFCDISLPSCAQGSCVYIYIAAHITLSFPVK